MKVLCIVNGTSGKSYHRSYGPIRDLHIRGFVEGHVHFIMDEVGNYNPIPDLKQFDLITWCESLGRIQQFVLGEIEKYDIPTIVDIDDHWMPNRYNPANAEYIQRGLWKATQECVYKASAVIVENERLGSLVNKINRNWQIVQNALDLTAMQWNMPKIPSDKFRVGFVGSRSHRYDLLMIADALREFSESGGVELHLCGYIPKDIEWIHAVNGIAPHGHPDWLKLHPAVHPNDYGMHYSQIDVSIAPLISNNFNAMKSDIKVKEAGAYCLPLIASDFGPYANHESAGVYTAKRGKEWLELLHRAKAGELDGRPNAEYLQDTGCLHYVNNARAEIYWAVCQSVAK